MATTVFRYAVRHKPTGHYIPEPSGRMGRGGSHVDPVEVVPSKLDTHPRMWPTERGAQNYLSQWLRGKHHALHKWEQDGWESPAYRIDAGTKIEHQPHRVREDMEIVKIPINL